MADEIAEKYFIVVLILILILYIFLLLRNSFKWDPIDRILRPTVAALWPKLCDSIKKIFNLAPTDVTANNFNNLRPVVIDGSNVAREHGKDYFSAKGIQLAINFFLNQGHRDVIAFVPKFRKHFNPNHRVKTRNPELLEDLCNKKLVVFTPSRNLDGKIIQSYDDRFIVQHAVKTGAVIVSNDNYNDLLHENDSFREAIEKRLLMFCFAGDEFMVPEDPLGRNGPKLSEFLRFPPNNSVR